MISLFLIFYHFYNEICTHSIYSINSPPFPSAHHCVKCLYSELFWSVTSRIRTEYGEITLCIDNSPVESLRIQSTCRKIWTTITLNTDTFYVVYGPEKGFSSWRITMQSSIEKTFGLSEIFMVIKSTPWNIWD